jgi:hypothetical protein
MQPSRHPRASKCVSLAVGYIPTSIQGSLSVYPWCRNTFQYHWRKDAPKEASKCLSLCTPSGGIHPNKHPRASKCVCLVAEYTPASIPRRLSVYPWRRGTPQQASKGLSVCIPCGGMHPSRHPRASKCVSLAVVWYTPTGIQEPLSVYPWWRDNLSRHPRASECVSLAEGCAPKSIQGSLTVYPNKHPRASKCVCLVAEHIPAGIQRRLSVYPWRRDTPQQASKGS